MLICQTLYHVLQNAYPFVGIFKKTNEQIVKTFEKCFPVFLYDEF